MTCPHDFTNPVRKGRANYACQLCGEDITMDLILIAEAQEMEKFIQEEHFTCPECGPHVASDEFLCCVTCGRSVEIKPCKCKLRVPEDED